MSADGRTVVSDPGQGIRAPGWHTAQRGTPTSITPPVDCASLSFLGGLEVALDVAKQVFDCLRNLTNILEILDEIESTIDSVRMVATEARKAAESLLNGQLDQLAIQAATLALDELKAQAVAKFETFIDLGPIGRARDIAECATGIARVLIDAICSNPACASSLKNTICSLADGVNSVVEAIIMKINEAEQFVRDTAMDVLCGAFDAAKRAVGLPVGEEPAGAPGSTAEIGAALNEVGAQADAFNANAEPTLDLFGSLGTLDGRLGSLAPNVNAVIQQLGGFNGGSFLLETSGGLFTASGFVSPTGVASLPAVTPLSSLEFNVYLPELNALFTAIEVASAAGVRTVIDAFSAFFFGPQDPDSDGDGVPDQAESIVGTRADMADSDGDGATDRLELIAQTNPRTNNTFPIGVISSLTTPGSTKAVAVDAAAAAGSPLLAFLATGDHGLVVADVSQAQTPVQIGAIDLPGDCQVVVVDLERQRAYLAAGTVGVHVVDISNPRIPRLLRTIAVPTGCNDLVARDGFLYCAGLKNIFVIDEVTSELFQSVPVATTQITDLVREGNTLFAMDTTGLLKAYDLSNIDLVFCSQLLVSSTGGKIFAGGGIVYLTATNNFRGGYATVDASNPKLLQLISDSDAAAPFTFGKKAFVPNGSGLGLLVGTNQNFNTVEVFDTTDLTQTSRFLTSILLPDVPCDVFSANGLAFVVTQSRGLQIVNFRNNRRNDQPPTVTLLTGVADEEPAPGIQVSNSQGGVALLPLADARDDVQVVSVSFINPVSGESFFTDVAFPFEAIFPISGTSGFEPLPSFQLPVQAVATDSAGQRGFSNILTFDVIQRDIPGDILIVIPEPNESIASVLARTYRMRLNQSVSTSSFSPNAFTLRNVQTNALVTLTSVQLRGRNDLITFGFDQLAPGDYELTLNSQILRKFDGSPFANQDLVRRFTVVDANVAWIGGNGFWDDPLNWSSGQVPGPTDKVLIATPGKVTIRHRTGTTNIQSLVLRENFIMEGGTLNIATSGDFFCENTFTNGTLDGGTLTFFGPTTWSNGTFAADRVVNRAPDFTILNGPTGSTTEATLGSTFDNFTVVKHFRNVRRVVLTGTAFNNQAGALFELGDGVFLNSTTLTLTNGLDAIFRKVGTANTTATVQLPVNNQGGQLGSQAGTLRFERAVNSTGGRLTAVAGAALDFAPNANSTWNGDMVGNIAGSVRWLGGNLDLTGGALHLTGNGFTWESGNLTNLTNRGFLQIVGTTSRNLLGPAPLTNSGTVVHASSNVIVTGPAGSTAVLNNLAGGLYETRAGNLSRSGVTVSLVNAGTLRKGTTGSFTFGLPMDSGAGSTIDVLAGTLILNNGGSLTDVTYSVAAGATLNLGGGGVFTVNGTHTGQLLGTLTQSAPFAVGNAILNFQGTPINSGGSINPQAGVANPSLEFRSPVLVTDGAQTWGNLALRNTSQMAFQGTANKSWNGTRFVNAAGASVDFRSGNIIAQNNPLLTNEGSVMKSTASTMSFGVPQDHRPGSTLRVEGGTLTSNGAFTTPGSMTIDVLGGTLTLNSGGSLTDVTYNVAAGATLNFGGGVVFTVNGTHTGPLLGTLTQAAPFAVGNAILNFQGTPFNSGGAINPQAGVANPSLEFRSPVLVTDGGQTWGNLAIRNTSQMAFEGAVTKVWNGTRFVNAAGASVDFRRGNITPQNNPLLTNEGTVLKTTTNSVTLSVPVTSSGTVETRQGELRFNGTFTQTAGLLFLNGGTFNFPTGLQLQGGELSGAGTVTGNVNNSGGSVRPGGTGTTGNLAITGTYTQGSGGRLVLEIGGLTAGTQFDRLTSTGAATLGGTLELVLLGGFAPVMGNTFQVLTYASRTGNFATVDGLTAPAPLAFAPQVNATNFTINTV